MFKKLVPVTKQRHQNITLSPVCDYSFANKLHSVPLAIIEFPVACVHLPIVFLKEQEKMFPHLFMGIIPGTNLCVDEKGSCYLLPSSVTAEHEFAPGQEQGPGKKGFLRRGGVYS